MIAFSGKKDNCIFMIAFPFPFDMSCFKIIFKKAAIPVPFHPIKYL